MFQTRIPIFYKCRLDQWNYFSLSQLEMTENWGKKIKKRFFSVYTPSIASIIVQFHVLNPISAQKSVFF